MILALSVIAVILTVSARFAGHKYVSAGLSFGGFFLVVASIVYALLLGAELEDVLVYVLVFALIGVIAFLPVKNTAFEKKPESEKEKNQDKADESEVRVSSETEEEQ